MLTTLLEFVHRLRDVAIPVSMVETLDAMASVRRIDLSDRVQLRAALGATLVKRAEHRAAFATLFDIHFGPRPAPPPPAVDPGAAAGLETDGGGLLDAMLDALRRNDRAALRSLTSLAVQRFAGIGAQRAGSAQYHLYRVLRQIDLSSLLRRAVQDDRDEAVPHPGLDERLARDTQRRRVESLRRMIADEIRRRLVELRGAAEVSRAYRPAVVEDVDFLSAPPGQLRAIRQAVRPLARTLAARLARRRHRRRRGRLDVRRTMRRSLSAGGVPLEPSFRVRRASRPDLFLLCDVSGSVAEFARFTMSLLYAMNDEFPRVRSFAFVDDVDEVSQVFEESGTLLDPSHLLARANVVTADGHSDYGRVFRRFWDNYGHLALGPKTTVIVTGDARNNYRETGVEALRAIAERARRLYWLNPEPRREWDTTDSVISAYAPHCAVVVEARNLRQLAAFVHQIA